MTATTATQFSVGGVLGEAFSILMRNIAPFVVISLIVTAPLFVYAYFAGAAVVQTTSDLSGTTVGVSSSIVGVGALAAWLLQIVLTQVAVGAISFGVFQEMRGQRADFGQCVARAIALIFPVLGVSIVTALAIGIGAVLLVVPGLILACMLWVVIPVAVVERPGVFASLSRSGALTKGHRWQIFGIVLIIGIAEMVASYLLARLFAGIGGFLLGQLAGWVVAAAGSAYTAVSTAVGYTTLRFAKEGIGIEDIARIFD
jgi:hypothetical protein